MAATEAGCGAVKRRQRLLSLPSLAGYAGRAHSDHRRRPRPARLLPRGQYPPPPASSASGPPRLPLASPPPPALSLAIHPTLDGTARLAACKAEEEPGLARGEDGVRSHHPRYIRRGSRLLTGSSSAGRRDCSGCTERDPCRSQPSRPRLSSTSSTSPSSTIPLQHAPSPSSAPRRAIAFVRHSTLHRRSARRPRSMPLSER